MIFQYRARFYGQVHTCTVDQKNIIGEERLLSDKRHGRAHNQTEVERERFWSDIIAYRHLKHDRRTIKTACRSGSFLFSVLSIFYDATFLPVLDFHGTVNSTKYDV